MRLAFAAVPPVLVVLLGLSTPAAADAYWKQSNAVWKAMDDCTRAARKQFPDHTAEASTKREAARQQCVHSRNLPDDADPPPQEQPADGRPR